MATIEIFGGSDGKGSGSTWNYASFESINNLINNSSIPTNAEITKLSLRVNADYDGGPWDGAYKVYLQFGFGTSGSIITPLLGETQIWKSSKNYPDDNGVNIDLKYLLNIHSPFNFPYKINGATGITARVYTDNSWVSGKTINRGELIVDYKIPRYTITGTVSSGGQSVSGGGEYDRDSVITLTATPFPGYRFLEWDDGNEDNPRQIIAKENVTYTAYFSPIEYTVTYNLNGGGIYTVDSISNPTTYTVESDTFTLNNPRRKGYTFKGWSGTGLTGDTNTSVKISKGSTGDRTYTANWIENYIEFEYWSNNRTEDNKKFAPSWKASPSSFPNGKADNHYNFTSGSYIQTYPGYKPALLEGYVSGGYYNTKPDGSGEYSVHEDYNFYNYLELCDKYGVKYYKPATTIPIYCQWEPEILVSYDTIFNYFDWYRREISDRSNCSVSNVTELGFTVTSNSTGTEGTVTSPVFSVEAGKKYKIDIDIIGNNWDVYIFFQDNNGTWLGTDSNSRFSSNGVNSNRIFEAPANAVQAQIRVYANGTNNTVRFENFRIYPADYYYMSYTVLKTDRSDCGQWSAPANPTRGNNNFYKFKHWSKDPGLEGKNSPVTTSGEFPTEDTVLFSQWDKQAPRIFIQEANKTGGKAAPIAQLHNKPIRKAFIYTTDSNKWKEC